MITLYHHPMSRSTTILSALDEMGALDQVTIRLTGITRADGSGGPDPDNPHPEGKVPVLVDGDTVVTERPAILTYLSDIFPEAEANRPVGHAQRGAFLSWMAYYGGVIEPVLVCTAAELTHPALTRNFRGYDEMAGRLALTLSDGRDYLLPDGFSTVDLLVASPFAWMRDWMPKDPNTVAWVERVSARPSVVASAARDQGYLKELARGGIGVSGGGR